MPTKIGIRVYQMTIYKARSHNSTSTDITTRQDILPDFVNGFVSQNTNARDITSEEIANDRRWYFEPQKNNTQSNNKGLVRYGIAGFESDLVNAKTNTRDFRRQKDHVEFISLFYEFWFPEKEKFSLVVFQSFAARSCVELILKTMRADFMKKYPGFSLNFRKLLPMGADGIYAAAPVKNLRFIKRNASSDLADRYLNAKIDQGIDFQIVINARRKGFLGTLGALANSMKAKNGGIIQHDGITFDNAVAEIEFGGQKRRIGLFGSNSEADVIDLTGIQRSTDGHPLFSDISKESTSILSDYYSYLKRRDEP